MDRARESAGFLETVFIAVMIWTVGAATYGIVEVIVNNFAGLYLPTRLWLFSVFVYTVLGLLGGLAAGIGTALIRQLLARFGIHVTPFLMAAFLAVLTLAYVGIPINDRLLPGILAPKSLIGNAILMVVCTGLGVLFYHGLRSEPSGRRAFLFVVMAFCVSICLAVGFYIDGYVPSLSGLSHRLGAYAGLVV